MKSTLRPALSNIQIQCAPLCNSDTPTTILGSVSWRKIKSPWKKTEGLPQTKKEKIPKLSFWQKTLKTDLGEERPECLWFRLAALNFAGLWLEILLHKASLKLKRLELNVLLTRVQLSMQWMVLTPAWYCWCIEKLDEFPAIRQVKTRSKS